MTDTGRHRGPKPAISQDFWPELQRMKRDGKTLLQMAAWLKENGVSVSEITVSRTMEKVRAASPAVVNDPPPLEPANDEDELKIIRALARDEMNGGDWKQRQGGASLLLRLRVEERATREAASPKDKDGDGAAKVWEPPTFGVKSSDTARA